MGKGERWSGYHRCRKLPLVVGLILIACLAFAQGEPTIWPYEEPTWVSVEPDFNIFLGRRTTTYGRLTQNQDRC